jgi:hypothetical protein
MTIRKGHGAGKGIAPRIEVLPPDELPAGIPAPTPLAEPTGERRKDGRFVKGARTNQSKGAIARKGTTRLSSMLGLASDDDPILEPYKRAANDFRRVEVNRLAREVGNGICGPGPASIIGSAALQLAASRYLFDHAGGRADMFKLASALANDSRQNLLAAHELVARQAKARPAAPASVPWLTSGEPASSEQEGDDNGS